MWSRILLILSAFALVVGGAQLLARGSSCSTVSIGHTGSGGDRRVGYKCWTAGEIRAAAMIGEKPRLSVNASAAAAAVIVVGLGGILLAAAPAWREVDEPPTSNAPADAKVAATSAAAPTASRTRCPCGGRWVERRRRSDGRTIYRCSRFPGCTTTRPGRDSPPGTA